MQNKKRNIIVIIIGIVLLLTGVVSFAFSRIVPSRAIDRPAITTEVGSVVNIDGFDLWYNLINSDSENMPIIVVAGGSGFSSDYIAGSLKFLANTHPVLFFDARGCGRSQIKSDLSNYSVSQMSEELRKLKDYFFPYDDVIILAHSFGGVVAMDYVADNENVVNKLILISSADTKYKTHYTDAFFKTGLPPRNQEKVNLWYMEHIDDFFGKYFANEEAKQIFDNMVTSYAVSAHVGGKSFDITDKVKNISVPTLILVGGKKEYPLTDLSAAQHLDEILDDSELINIPDSGHFMFAENAAEFQRVICEWID